MLLQKELANHKPKHFRFGINKKVKTIELENKNTKNC